MNTKITKALALILVTAIMGGCTKTSASDDNKDTPVTTLTNNATHTITLVSEDDIKTYNFTDKAMEYLNYIGTNLTDRDCTNSKSDHQGTIDFIVSELKTAGYNSSQIEVINNSNDLGLSGLLGLAKIQNVVLTIPGKSSDKLIIVGGHYDGNGIGDNGSGLALMLANAVGLYGVTPAYDVKFVFFDAEEIGLKGSAAFVENMSSEDKDRTYYMINIDSIAFGDYCNIYGGTTDFETGVVSDTSIYELACSKADYLNINVCGIDELDGYFNEHGTGPDIEDNTLYTSPWTASNPAPSDSISGGLIAYAPSTIPASDHVFFVDEGIPYVYFEATNWFAAGNFEGDEYTGYIEVYDSTLGDGGMFMNTEYDTLDNLNALFPGRAEAHFNIYSPLLSSLILNPDGEELLG